MSEGRRVTSGELVWYVRKELLGGCLLWAEIFQLEEKPGGKERCSFALFLSA